MEVQPLSDEHKHHRITFYQSALTLFAKQANNNAMTDQVQYCTIANAMLRLWNGESLSSLRKKGYANIHQWKKKYSIMQCTGKNQNSFTILLEKPRGSNRKKKRTSWHHKNNSDSEEDDGDLNDSKGESEEIDMD